MEDFVADYPTSTKRNTAYIDVADYYFEQGKYPQALKWYDRVMESNMSHKERERFNFNKGYALFTAKKYKDSRAYFETVTHTPTYGAQAKYYIGYMAYQSDDYRQANQYFDQIQTDEQLSEKLSYYQADMSFKTGDFNKAIEQATNQLQKSNDADEVSELNKIIGESYFNLKEYDKAIPFLTNYKGKKANLIILIFICWDIHITKGMITRVP